MARNRPWRSLSQISLSLTLFSAMTASSFACSVSVSEIKLLFPSLLRISQANYLEFHQFSKSFAELEALNGSALFRFTHVSRKYTYSLKNRGNAVIYAAQVKPNLPESEQWSIFQRPPTFWENLIALFGYMPCGGYTVKKPIHSYIAMVYANETDHIQAIMCEAKQTGSIELRDPLVINDQLVCNDDAVEISLENSRYSLPR